MVAIQPPPPQSRFLNQPLRWQKATWDDYIALRDDETQKDQIQRLFFDNDQLWLEMGQEGINHASYSDLFIMLLLVWKQHHPEQILHSLGRCLLEKMGYKAGAPDLVVYQGNPIPRWEEGTRRYLNLDQERSPDLVGEISDTTLATDLDEKKRLYASLGIREYWVIDIKGGRVFCFSLTETGLYQQTIESQVLIGVSMALLEQTLNRLSIASNTDAALWFSEQLTVASSQSETP